MTQLRTLGLLIIAVFVVGPLFFADSYRTAAQDKKLKITIQAQAMGTSTQLGQTFNITAIVNELSPPEDQKVLLDAFQAKGNEGLVNALSKMRSKGRLAITGTLGGDLAYIRRFHQPDGTIVIRMITNRLLRFGEVWYDSRSTDYQLSGLEIVVGKDKKKATGTLLPAAQLKMDKKGQLEIENYQNPWKLTNVRVR
jgi:hypothetical protein